MSKEEILLNIQKWEEEVQEALNKGNIMKAVECRILANILREDLEDN